MSLLPIEVVTLAGDKLVTDSRRVAQHFSKRHDNVLRAIGGLDCSDEFRRLNFEDCFEINGLANGKPVPLVKMTKDGFMFLAMGFTGMEAARIKEAYIKAFNMMAEELQRRDQGLWQQMQALIAKEVDSQVRASFGSSLLHKRRKEIPFFRRERARLESEIQPTLPLLS